MNLNQLINAQINVQTIILGAIALGVLLVVGRTVWSLLATRGKVDELSTKFATIETSITKKINDAVASSKAAADKANASLTNELNRALQDVYAAKSLISNQQEKTNAKVAEAFTLIGQVAKGAQWANAASSAPSVQASAPAVSAQEQIIKSTTEAAKKVVAPDFVLNMTDSDRQKKVMSFLQKPSDFKFRSLTSLAKSVGVDSKNSASMSKLRGTLTQMGSSISYNRQGTHVALASTRNATYGLRNSRS